MKEWYSAKELAGLPSMPSSDRRVRERAKNKHWTSRARIHGKGYEYHLDSLPAETKHHLKNDDSATTTSKGTLTAKRLISEEVLHCKSIKPKQEAGLVSYASLTKRSKLKVDAKLEILNQLELMQTSVENYVSLFNSKSIEIEGFVFEFYGRVTEKTIYRWRQNFTKNGIQGLIENRGKNRTGSSILDSCRALNDFVIGMLVQHPHISCSVLYKSLKTEFHSSGIKIPTKRTLERWVANWKLENRQLYTAVTNPDAWKNKYMTAFGSASEDVTELNQLWEFDSTPADLLLIDGNRYNILGVIDVYSRRLILIVSRTSNSKAVAQVIRRAIINWGIPSIAKTDNGADYKSTYIRTVFKSLNIEQQFCPPFQAWKKPHIERVFRSFSHHLLELLPGFAGHNVAERKSIEARKQFSDRLFQKDAVIEVGMTSEELQRFCHDWVENHYHISEHSETKKTPNAMVRDWNGSIRKVENERALDILLSEPAGARTITKKGLSVDGSNYIHPELAVHVGKEVHVYYDDSDMGRVYVYGTDGVFICIAEDPSLTGVSRMEVAQRAKARQKEVVQERRRELKTAAKHIKKRDIAHEILAHQAAQARAEKVTDFPRPTETHSSDGLTAAADALSARDGKFTTGMTEAELQEIEQIKAEVLQPNFNRQLVLPEDMAEKYQLWVSLDEKVKSGLKVESIYEGFYKSFPRSAEYESGKMLAELRQQTASRS